MECNIKKMTEEDFDQALAIEMDLEQDTWGVDGFKISFIHDEAFALTINDNKDIIGFLFGYETVDEFNISNIAIKKEYRHKGFGYYLLSNIIEMKKHIKNFFLEVRTTNTPALSLYQKMGFKPLYIRKGYYQNPTGDALIMCLSINNHIL
ncbi:MAG TPA: ribosomal protein S18-alanine N-acetyltransferase [Candidatus Cloacimonadota bacterium]|nr:ribosomal protein S18-alanine N-acetyltransferase [Candidatus Cloacimonadota bacterium]HQB40133.1 ribosomal protein S18-alanine N-acetyltransferase [Candidatus Cloacimonadota bacterium]